MKCADCPDYKACRRQNDLRRKRHKCKKANEPFVQTNADRIRAMSDEELARVFDRGCPPDRPPKECMKYWHVGCEGCWLEYLRQPVKDGDNDGKSNDPE